MVSFEEVEFAHRLRRRGGRMLYDPEMVIYHHVPGERMTKDYVAQRRYWDGRSFSAFERTRAGWLRQWAIGLALIILVLVRDLPGLLISSILGDSSQTFVFYCRTRRARGYIDEMLRWVWNKRQSESAAQPDASEATQRLAIGE